MPLGFIFALAIAGAVGVSTLWPTWDDQQCIDVEGSALVWSTGATPLDGGSADHTDAAVGDAWACSDLGIPCPLLWYPLL